MLILDMQKTRLVEEPEHAGPGRVLECDLLIAGGGMGGCAAALAACRAGRTVILTEETGWLGGQMTNQGVSALDEHRYIEEFGGTRSYYELREAIRRHYRENAWLTPAASGDPLLNPGNGWVSRLCFEPEAGVRVLEALLEPHRQSGRLMVLPRHKAVSATVEGDVVRGVTFRHLDGEDRTEVRAAFVLDATELGDLLPLTGTEYVTGAESAAETGEPGARADGPARECVQSFTYPFALEHATAPGEAVAEPEGYALNRERQPYTLRHLYHDRGWVLYWMFGQAKGTPGSFWEYRRLIDASQFADPRYARDVAMINWPGNDYRHGNLIDVPPEAALQALREAKALALGFCRWLQTECPRDEGGAGYPELRIRPEVMGTADGLSMHPYIRESRRIRALTTVVEQDIAARCQPGPRARLFADSAGIGLYAIDIHPAEGEAKLPPDRAHPFQVPLGALVPVRMRNLLPACKNLGVTHITNGAYRLHPVEWNIGESSAHLAGYCLETGLSPQAVAGDAVHVRALQRQLVRTGVPLYWHVDVPLDHPAFEAVQLLAAWDVWRGDDTRLELGPQEPAGAADLARLAEAPEWALQSLAPLIADPPAASFTRADLAVAAYRRLTS